LRMTIDTSDSGVIPPVILSNGSSPCNQFTWKSGTYNVPTINGGPSNINIPNALILNTTNLPGQIPGVNSFLRGLTDFSVTAAQQLIEGTSYDSWIYNPNTRTWCNTVTPTVCLYYNDSDPSNPVLATLLNPQDPRFTWTNESPPFCS
jgi:hypothetical protein